MLTYSSFANCDFNLTLRKAGTFRGVCFHALQDKASVTFPRWLCFRESRLSLNEVLFVGIPIHQQTLSAHNLEESVHIILFRQCEFQRSHSTWKGHWALKHGPPCDCTNGNIARFASLTPILWTTHSQFQEFLGNVSRVVQNCVAEYGCHKFGPLHARTMCDFMTQGMNNCAKLLGDGC